ncbi:MAG: hypothetical protein FJ278_23820, partial [Planctomycetes bacterium]|nr:hypothetical protein [Planctomycetota bacterium]
MSGKWRPALVAASILLGPLTGCAGPEKAVRGPKSPAGERAATPEWVATGKHSRYPEGAFLSAVGAAASTGKRADDSARADENARAELAKTIRVSVQSTFTDIMRSALTHTGQGPKGKSEQFTEYLARSEIKLQLEHAQVADRYYDREEKTYYALAVLDRQRAAESLARQVT